MNFKTLTLSTLLLLYCNSGNNLNIQKDLSYDHLFYDNNTLQLKKLAETEVELEKILVILKQDPRYQNINTIRQDRNHMNNFRTVREISEACLKNPEGTAETGGVIYNIPTNQGYRLGFSMIDNVTNKYSAARKLLEEGESLDLEALKSEIKSYTVGKCSMYAKNGYKTEIDKLLRDIDVAISLVNIDRIQELELAQRALGITNSTYIRGIVPHSENRIVGEFHVHNNGTTFSPVDHCIYDNRKDTTQYLIICKSDRYEVHRLVGAREFKVIKGKITKQ